MTEHWPVVVVGGGPSGLAAAIELGRAEVPVLVLEPRTVLVPLRPRAKTTSARTMELLRRWGLADRVRAAAPLPVAHAEDVVFCTGLQGREITRFRHAFAMHAARCDEFAEGGQQIPQPVVEQVLRDAVGELPAVTLRTGHRATAVDDGPDAVRLRVTDAGGGPGGPDYEVVADRVLGCDGAGGVTRDAIGATYVGSSGERPNLSITFSSHALTEDRLCARAAHYWVVGGPVGGLLGRLDLDGTWWAIAQGVRPGDDVDPAALVRALAGGEIDVEVLATDPWTARMLLVDRYRGHRVFLVGDAAHLNPPWGGHGYNTCVGDAVNIAWKLAAVHHGWAGEALLDSYEPERRPVAAQTIADAATQESLLAGAFHGVADAALAEALQAKRAEFHSLGLVLGYHYAGSPAVVDDGTPHPPHDPVSYRPSGRPGARLPHRWCDDGSSLFDHLGTGLSLLRTVPDLAADGLVDAARSRGVPLAVVDSDPAHRAADREARGADLLLVRPDQHVAWRGDELPSRAGVDVLLDRVLGPLPLLTDRPAALAAHPGGEP